MHMGNHRGTDQPVAIMDATYAHSKAHQRDISPYCMYTSLQKAREPSTNRVQSNTPTRPSCLVLRNIYFDDKQRLQQNWLLAAKLND